MGVAGPSTRHLAEFRQVPGGIVAAFLALEHKQPLYVFSIPLISVGICSFFPLTLISGGSGLLPNLIIPNGPSQKIDELNGSSNVPTLQIRSTDADGTLKQLIANTSILGTVCTLKLGFPGMALDDFYTLHTWRLVGVGRDSTGLMTFTVQDILQDTIQDIFINGGPDTWAVGDLKNPQHTPPPSVRDNGIPISKDNPRYFSGNPINLFLAVMQNELGVGQLSPPALVAITGGGSGTGAAGFGINPSWTFYDGVNNGTLINPNPYLDITAILAMRDSFFLGERMEFTFTSSQNGKSWVEDQLLKPMGLVMITEPSGQIKLKSLKHIVASVFNTVAIISNDQIIGIPNTNRLPIINMVQVTMPASTDTTNSDTITVSFVQNISVNTFGYQASYSHSVTSDGLRFVYGGFGTAFRLANRIFNRHAFSTPEYDFTTFFEFITLNVGDFISLTHPLLLDPLTGDIGVGGILCEVTERQPDYAKGTITFKAIDTRFIHPATIAGQIASAGAGIPVWASASSVQRATYMFIADNTGKMSDGSPGNQIE